MIRKITESDYPRLIDIWESAVSATHDFLDRKDFLYYREHLPGYFECVSLYGFEQDGVLAGFVGVAEGNVEMLFVHDDFRGRGIGKSLLQYAVSGLWACKVDVNEQNTQAVGFYMHLGFSIVGRSETDPDGKPYPILHLGQK